MQFVKYPRNLLYKMQTKNLELRNETYDFFTGLQCKQIKDLDELVALDYRHQLLRH